MLFYVRRHTGADGSFEWYVLNGHTLRRASNFFPTRAAGGSGAGEVADAARPGQGKSPFADGVQFALRHSALFEAFTHRIKIMQNNANEPERMRAK